MKACRTCKVVKDLSEYHPHNKSKDGTINQCRECRNAYVKAYRSTLSRTESNRIQTLKAYGLTLEDYDNLLESQDGVCAICGCPPEESVKGILAVDHCHNTGQVRGLLCGLCNTALGKFKDNIRILQNAVAYLTDAGY